MCLNKRSTANDPLYLNALEEVEAEQGSSTGSNHEYTETHQPNYETAHSEQANCQITVSPAWFTGRLI